MKVYLVVRYSTDMGWSERLIKIFANRDSAEAFVRSHEFWTLYDIEEREIEADPAEEEE